MTKDTRLAVVGVSSPKRPLTIESLQHAWIDMHIDHNGFEADLDGSPEPVYTYGTVVLPANEEEVHHIWSDDTVRLAGWTGIQLEIAASEVRDHLSNERTFLSNLKLSLYLSVVGVSSLLNIRLPGNATTTIPDKRARLSDQLVLPLTYVFFFLAVANLLIGTSNYYRTQARYIAKVAHVQEHWTVKALVLLTGIVIILACLVLVSEDT